MDAYLSFSDYATTWKENMIIFLTTNRVSSDVYMGKHQTLLTTCDSTNLTYIIQCKRCKKKKQYTGETKRTLREHLKDFSAAGITTHPQHVTP